MTEGLHDEGDGLGAVARTVTAFGDAIDALEAALSSNAEAVNGVVAQRLSEARRSAQEGLAWTAAALEVESPEAADDEEVAAFGLATRLPNVEFTAFKAPTISSFRSLRTTRFGGLPSDSLASNEGCTNSSCNETCP